MKVDVIEIEDPIPVLLDSYPILDKTVILTQSECEEEEPPKELISKEILRYAQNDILLY